MNYGMRCHDLCPKTDIDTLVNTIAANHVDQIQLAMGKSIAGYNFDHGHYSPGFARMIRKKLDENDEKIMRLIYDKKAIILLNKSDLETVVDENLIREKISNLKKEAEQTEKSEGQRYQVSENIPVIQISAKEEQGIQTFQDTLKEMFLRGNISFNEEIYITNARQKNALVNALESMKKVIESIENGMPEDFYSIDLMDAYEELGNITGESMGEDLVNEIFSKFCMGK